MPRPLDIACLQTRPMPDFQSALDEATGLARTAIKAGAQILFLPEYCGGLRTDQGRVTPPVAPENTHPVLQGLQVLAAEHRVWINIGSLAITGADGMILNRGYMIDDAGHVCGRYDKIHMFDIRLSDTESYRESATVSPGSCAVIHDTPMARIGHTICYDLRFPNLFRNLAQAGAEIICCPAAFTKVTGAAHWHILNRARAIETTRFVVSPCAIGRVPGGGESYGHSVIVDPWGKVISDGGAEPGIITATIDLDMIAVTAARIPSLNHGRDYAPAVARCHGPDP